MRTYEFRTYNLASPEAVEAYKTVYYPNHEASLRELFGVIVHGYWTPESPDGFQFNVLMSYPEGADAFAVRQQYREHPDAAKNMPDFDPSVILGVEARMLVPAPDSPLQ